MLPSWASEVRGKRGMRQVCFASALVSLTVLFALGACAPTGPGPRLQGKAGSDQPELVGRGVPPGS